MRHRIRPTIAGLAAITVAMSFLAACGSDDDKSSTTTAAASTDSTAAGSDTTGASSDTTTAEPTKSEIKVGVITTLSGAQASNATGTPLAATAWEKWTNSHGGVNGHPVKLVIADDGSDGAKGLTAVQNLVENEKVVALAGINAVPSEAAWADYVKSKNIPVVGGAGYGSPWFDNEMFFPTITLVTAGTLIPWQVGIDRKLKAGIAIVCSEVEVCLALDAPMRAWSDENGFNLLPALKAGFADPNYLTQCTTAKNEGVDIIGLSVAQATAIRIINDCLSQGYGPIFEEGGTAIGVAQLGIKDPNFKFVGTAENLPWFYEGPENADFREAMDLYAGGKDNEAWQQNSSQITWTSLEMFKKTLENAPDTVTSQDVIDGLYTIKDETLGGLLPKPITYTTDLPHSFNNCSFIMEIKDGAYTMPQGLTPVCTTPVG